MLRFGSMFSGVGLLDLGLTLAGVDHAWFCEWDPWRRDILRQRWPGAPVLDDVRRVGVRTVERVDGIAGGFPCKGVSTAGKRNGFDHAETVLWREMRRAVGELRPRYVVVENVANLLALHDGAVWGEVLGDLAALGYVVRWDCLPAAAVGAPHRRDRVFAVASYAERVGWAAGTGLREGEEGRGPGGVGRGRSGDGDGEAAAAADSARDAEGGAGAEAGPDGERVGPGDHVVADADGGGVSQFDVGAVEPGGGASHGDDALRRGVPVAWGSYEPAIRRWESIVGAAPEPLVRGVDDRGARRVDRSRLSALGDGVQVQVGRLVGEYVMGLERERLGVAA